MTAIPLLSGVAGSETGEFVRTFPLNLEPIIVDSGISKGQLRAVPGAVQMGTGPGPDRGGIFWNGVLYRVMGTSLCSIGADGTLSILGDVGPGLRCWFDYSFDRLAIGSNSSLFYYTPNDGLSQVTDTDLGVVIDGLWIDGYFMTTDGTYVIVTELADPTQVQPLKFGSAEEDPDPITGLLKYRDEAYALGRFTIQTFRNVGGNGFPFETIKGATIPFGCVGPYAKCLFGDGFVFVGGARNEGLNVYAGGQGTAEPIGCRELCDELDALPNSGIVEVEVRGDRAERRLLIHLPDQTWVFLITASTAAGMPIWYRIKTDANGYRCRNAVDAYGLSIVGDTQSGSFGRLANDDRNHFGIDPDWEIETALIYNQGQGAILHGLELSGLPGRGGNGSVFLSTTRDGETWSMERAVKLLANQRQRRIAWRPHARVGNYLGLRFRGNGSALPGIAALEAKLQGLGS